MGFETSLWCISTFCSLVHFQVTLAGYKKFLAVEVILRFQSFHLDSRFLIRRELWSVNRPLAFLCNSCRISFPRLPLGPWVKPKRSKKPSKKPKQGLRYIRKPEYCHHQTPIRCQWTPNTTLWVGLHSLYSQRQQMQSENTVRAPKTMSNWPLVRL